MKIKGKFAPLTDELGYDPRFKELNDLEKLMYVLIIHTCHMTRHQAPTDPNYYRMQYGIRHRYAEVKQAISKCQAVYKQLSNKCGKLSLLNSPTYRNEIRLEEETEEEVDTERRIENKTTTFNQPQKLLERQANEDGKKEIEEKFNVFWSAYKRKEGKEDAKKAFTKLLKEIREESGKVALFEAMLLGLKKQEPRHQKLINEGTVEFIPLPGTWIRGQRWKDEVYKNAVANQDRQDKRQFIDGLKLANSQGASGV